LKRCVRWVLSGIGLREARSWRRHIRPTQNRLSKWVINRILLSWPNVRLNNPLIVLFSLKFVLSNWAYLFIIWSSGRVVLLPIIWSNRIVLLFNWRQVTQSHACKNTLLELHRGWWPVSIIHLLVNILVDISWNLLRDSIYGIKSEMSMIADVFILLINVDVVKFGHH
jgi:hypothetical protein